MLKKQLGLLSVFSIAAGAMISSGLFILPGLAFAKAGPSIIISYFLAGLLMIPSMLSNAELATAMPKSGGSYFFVERSLGPLMGTFAGFANWLAIALKATFAMVGIGALATVFAPDTGELTIKFVSAAACLFFLLVNLLSVKGTGGLQIGLVAGLIAILIAFIVKSLPFVVPQQYSPFAPFGVKSIFAVSGMVFVSFGGLTKVIDVSEEVHNSQKNIPLGMFIAFFVVNILYVLVVFATVGVLKPETLSGSLTPIALAAKIVAGNAGEILISIGAFLAFATTANAGLLSASRTPMAMSRDGLVPQFLSKSSSRFHTPHFSLILTAAVMLVVIFALSVENLVKTASAIMIIMFILMNASVVIMRHSGIQSYRPTFKAPFSPWLQIGTIIIYLFLIFEMGYVPLALTGIFAVIAMIWFLFYVQRRIDRESAIVYLVKTIVSRHIQRSGLEEELKQLALERDEIVTDRFDGLVKNCDILDIPDRITATELFHTASNALSKKLNIDSNKLYDLFIQRERESTTVIKSGLAIPHIVVDGLNVFEILLVRCKEGAIFSELHEPVKTAFILLGSSDERNYHLRALMSIAHIVSEPEFEKRWFAAKNTEQLRDIVLLSGRRRD
ncbi:MAG: amino acid permease [Phycisphaerae bacterium]|jgi:amino acid transporter/mannitol/fructose-specific phosphotransferase system IIA component (Ntr-type)